MLELCALSVLVGSLGYLYVQQLRLEELRQDLEAARRETETWRGRYIRENTRALVQAIEEDKNQPERLPR